jgi:hypothetical protein
MFAATARQVSPSPTGTIVRNFITMVPPGRLSPAPSLSIAGDYLRGFCYLPAASLIATLLPRADRAARIASRAYHNSLNSSEASEDTQASLTTHCYCGQHVPMGHELLRHPAHGLNISLMPALSGCSTTMPAWDGITILLGGAITTTVSALKVPHYDRFDLWLEPIYTAHRHLH